MSDKSLVLELQSLAQENATDLAELLRRAKVVAAKLRLGEVEAWIEHEMNGYHEGIEVPKYRKIATHLVMEKTIFGTQAVRWGEGLRELAEHFASINARQSVGELAHMLAAGGEITVLVSPSEMAALLKVSDDFRIIPVSRHVSRSGVANVLNSVRNKILDWALQLERQGILGAGMTFSKEETQAAAGVTILNYGALIQGSHASVAMADSSPGATVTTAKSRASVQQRVDVALTDTQRNRDWETALQRIMAAVQASQQLSPAKKDEATEQLAFIAEQCALPPEQRHLPSILTPVLETLRGTLGLSVDVLHVWSTFEPTICAVLRVGLG
ncbi:AbiTii domain-containing protein [Hyalangium gracile]|uniref:AbiTii domain-containing protein n=1 Tax=Hyalangium gracile TaxID=394092 RepID=UPI001CCEBDD2|nr:hypothetical protein [Hyalangium gracile]